MVWCLVSKKAQQLKKDFLNNKIKISDLLKMETNARKEFFSKYVGGEASSMNLAFEKKLILKNKIQGLKNFVSKATESGKYDSKMVAEAKIKLEEFKKLQEKRILSPEEEQTFLGSLADKLTGIDKVTREQSKNIFELSKKVDETKKVFDNPNVEYSKEYGVAKQIYERYIEDIKTGDGSLKNLLKDYGKEIGLKWKENKPATVTKVLSDTASEVSKNLINLVASWDNSFMGRQGAITLTKSPKIWWNMAKKSFSDFANTLGGKQTTDALWADIYARRNYVDGWYGEAKLFPKFEEQFPTKTIERVPVLGRAIEASDVAFTGSAIRARSDLFDMMAKVYEGTGNKMNKLYAEDIGTVVNAITARGKVGQIGSSKPVQLLLWAPRMLKADWDILTAHTFGSGLKTNFARKEAAKTIFGVTVATAGIMAIAEAMGAEVEKDPTSTNFTRIRINNTTINIPFARGIPQIVTLMARLITKQSKDSQTNIKTKLNSGEYGSKNLFDIGLDFLANKTTPPVRAVINYLKGRDISGEKPTIGSTAFGLTPISVQNFIGLEDESSTEAVMGAFLDLIGIGSNTYQRETDWEKSTSKEMIKFKSDVGEEKFKEANDKFNSAVNNMYKYLRDNAGYKGMSDEDRQKIVDQLREEIKKEVLSTF